MGFQSHYSLKKMEDLIAVLYLTAALERVVLVLELKVLLDQKQYANIKMKNVNRLSGYLLRC